MNDPVIKGFPTDQGTALYDFGALANVPEPLKEMPAATVGQYLVVEEVDTEGKIKKVKTVAGPDSTQNAPGVHIGDTPPEDTSLLWVDTSDETEDEDPLEGYYTSTETDAAIKSYLDTALGVIENGTY